MGGVVCEIGEEATLALEADLHGDRCEPVQFVTPEGTLTEAGSTWGVDLERAQTLYRHMSRGRRFDGEALALQRQGELGLWLQCRGQEAAQVGSIHALRADEYVFPSYREHAAALARGITPSELLSQWRGTSHAGWDREQYNFHFYSLVLGTQTLHATGYAMGAALDGGGLVATYFGDGAASQGDVNEAFNWAAVQSLPVLFICQNNQWAISTPTALQFRSPIYQRAAGFGIRAFHVDGNDALAVNAVTAAAADLVRSGAGPALIEAVTCRMAGHSTSDDPARYRDPAELAGWELRDPLVRLERLLIELGVAPSFFAELQLELDDFAADVRRACTALEAPELDSLFELTYAESHPSVAADRSEYRRFTNSFS